MRIIEAPQFKICECVICGTIFQPEIHDELHYVFKPAEFMPSEIYTRCPTCSNLTKITKITKGE